MGRILRMFGCKHSCIWRIGSLGVHLHTLRPLPLKKKSPNLLAPPKYQWDDGGKPMDKSVVVLLPYLPKYQCGDDGGKVTIMNESTTSVVVLEQPLFNAAVHILKLIDAVS